MKVKIMVIAVAVLSVSCSGGAIYENEEFAWYSDSVRQGEYVSRPESVSEIVSDYPAADGSVRRWTRKNSISRFGKYTGADMFETALYNMAADELINNVEADSTLRTGALWGGVWTRDVSYSIVLSLADMLPEVSRTSLMRKVDRLGRIVQDTGTGGSWPCSSDRVVWALAAWKIYLATGDENWLRDAYSIVRRSLEDDYMVTFDSETGLFCGESSFIDWREQSYPRWMQPVDIYRSECLGTNAVYYSVFLIMSRMAAIQGLSSESEGYSQMADRLRDAINRHLWMEDKGYYAQFLYGRDNLIVSPRSETLGESLAILSGIASGERAGRIVSSMPLSSFGPTIFWPQICDVPNYHNNAIWPFVTSYYAYASAKAGNEDAVLFAIASNVRAAAIYATNHENMVASDGSLGTELNSHNMLWSIAGFLGMYRHLLMGLDMTPDGIAFAPFVPYRLRGERKIEGLRYRNMTLDIIVKGHGSGIKSFRLDGVPAEAFVPSDMTGCHTVEIVLDGNHDKGNGIDIQPYTASPSVPSSRIEDGYLRWEKADGAEHYLVLHNGVCVDSTVALCCRLDGKGEYQVIAVNNAGVQSFACEPLRFNPDNDLILIPVDKWLYRGKGSVETTVIIPEEGIYRIAWEYANGSGCTAQKNMCATRSLYIDGSFSGVSVFPQRGDGEWDNLGWSNSRKVHLSAGKHTVSLTFGRHNENMNIDVNTVYISALRISGEKTE